MSRSENLSLILNVGYTLQSIVSCSGLARPAWLHHNTPHLAGATRNGSHQNRASDVHPRATLAARDVRRLLCSPRLLFHVSEASLRNSLHASQHVVSLRRIPDQPTPEARMIQCVRWYLSAFHAGRRSSVAKKPYNPIIGEIFQCYYQLPHVEDSEVGVLQCCYSLATLCHCFFVCFADESV